MTDAPAHRICSEAEAPPRLFLEACPPVRSAALPHHEQLARSTFVQGLAASGWHTASVAMRLVVQALPIAGVIGGGVDDLRWPKPLRPGDELRLKGESVEVGPRGRSRAKDLCGCGRRRSTERARRSRP
jgi:hypothetical protein